MDSHFKYNEEIIVRVSQTNLVSRACSGPLIKDIANSASLKRQEMSLDSSQSSTQYSPEPKKINGSDPKELLKTMNLETH